MRDKFVKTKMNTNDHRRKRLTKMALRLVLSATTLSAILAGCGVSYNVTTEEVESDLTPITTEANNKVSEYSYLYDRLADTYGEFKVDVKEDGKTYTITVKVDDEEIFGYELTYDEATHIFTCNEDIILDEIELVEGNIEYITSTDDIISFVDDDIEYKQVDMNVGKRFKVEEVEESDLNEAGYDVELEDSESAYKVIYLDLEGSAEVTPNDTPVATNPSPTPNNNTPKPPVTTPSTSNPSANNENSNVVTPTTEAPAVPSVPSTPSTTETPNVPTTEEIKECQHNWVEVTETREVFLYMENECLNCGYVTTDLNDCINHCSNSGCAGYYTHEELINAGWKEGDPIYQTMLGKAKGTSYHSYPVYNYEKVPTGRFCCDKCYIVKQ